MIYRFHGAELDTDLFVLRGNERVVRLAPKAFAVLEQLIRGRERVVSKQELLDEVWSDVAVSEGALAQCVRSVRRALQAVGVDQPLIESAYGRGYRFVGRVDEVGPADFRADLAGHAERTVSGFGGRPAIAVLPLESLSDSPDQDYFAAGVTEDLVHRLASWRWFPVIAPRSPRESPDKEIGRELGVRYAIRGSVRREGERIRVTLRVTDADTAQLVCTERYDGSLSDIFALQDAASEALVARITPELQRNEMHRALRKSPSSLDAWDSFLRGIWYLQRYTAEDNAHAREHLARAHELDPGFAAPLALEALSHLNAINAAWTRDPREAIGAALELSRRAVTVDDGDTYAHGVLGGILATLGQREDAIAELARAIELNPSFALPYWGLGRGYTVWGRAREALELFERALRLSPRDAFVPHFLEARGFAHFALHEYAEAASWAERSIRERSDWARAHQLRAAACAWLGRVEDARASLERMFDIAPAFGLDGIRLSYRIAGAEPDLAERYVGGLERAGWHELTPQLT